MGFTRNTINDTEHKDRSLVVLGKINSGNYNRVDTTELFFLYNDRLTPRKQDINCAACRNYVWNALKRYYGV